MVPRLLAGLSALALFTACGTQSRQVQAVQAFARGYGDAATVEALRGRQPTLARLWMESARLELARLQQDPTALASALALLEEGLAFSPGDPGLLMARIDLLSQTGRPAEALAAVETLLTTPLRAAERDALLDAALPHALRLHFELGDLEAVEPLLRRLGQRDAVHPGLLAEGWSQLAVERTHAGQKPGGDAAFDRALAAEPSVAVAALSAIAWQRPERGAATRTLRAAALARTPSQPDLLLAEAIERMDAGDLPGARTDLDAVVPPPERLVPVHEALRARVDLLSGDLDAGLARLAARLDADPLDGPALDVLEESWRRHGRPDDAGLAERLWRARRALPAEAVQARRDLDALLDQLQADVTGPPAPHPEAEGAGT